MARWKSLPGACYANLNGRDVLITAIAHEGDNQIAVSTGDGRIVRVKPGGEWWDDDGPVTFRFSLAEAIIMGRRLPKKVVAAFDRHPNRSSGVN